MGEVLVADDLAELGFGFEHAGGRPAQAHVAVLPALDVAAGGAADADHRLDWVRRGQRFLSWGWTPRRCSVTVSVRPSRSDAAAPGCECASSPANASRRSIAAR